MPRLATGRGLRKHWNYDVAEVAAACGVHRNTVRRWIKDGLPVVSDQKPYLMRGGDVIAYLRARNEGRKQPCGNGRIYCAPCHAPKRPAGGMAEYVPESETNGKLIGICPDCERIIRRPVSLNQLDEVASGLDVSVPNTGGGNTLGNVTNPPVNGDSSEVKNR